MTEENPRTEGGGETFRRYLGAGLLLGFFVFICGGLIAVPFFMRGTLPKLTESKLKDAEVQWRESRPASYRVEVKLSAAREEIVRAVVEEGLVVEVTRAGRRPPPRTWDNWTVDGLFETIRRDLEMAEDPEGEIGLGSGTQLVLRAEFDRKLGYPIRYRRHVIGGSGPTVSWEVTSFAAE